MIKTITKNKEVCMNCCWVNIYTSRDERGLFFEYDGCNNIPMGNIKNPWEDRCKSHEPINIENVLEDYKIFLLRNGVRLSD